MMKSLIRRNKIYITADHQGVLQGVKKSTSPSPPNPELLWRHFSLKGNVKIETRNKFRRFTNQDIHNV